MEQKLVVFGCSFTYGHGLPDCLDGNNIGPGSKPSKFSWANHLKTSLGLSKLTNKGIPGASNKIILNEIVNYDFKKEPTKVVILWSNFERKTIFYSHNQTMKAYGQKKLHMMPAFIYKDQMPESFWEGYTSEEKDEYVRLIKTYYEDYHHDYDCVYENSMLINYAHAYLQSKGIENFHLIMQHSLNKHKRVFNNLKIDTLKAKTFSYLKDFHIDDGLDKQKNTRPHPGVKSQIHFANNIKKWFF